MKRVRSRLLLLVSLGFLLGSIVMILPPFSFALVEKHPGQ